MFWRRRKIGKNLKTAAEIAGDQIIAPGAGTLLLVIGGLAAAGAATYFVARTRSNKKAAQAGGLSEKN